MKKNFVRLMVLGLLVGAVAFVGSMKTNAGDVKIILLGGPHAGQCVNLSSYPAHQAHDEYYVTDCDGYTLPQ